jgi:outer membrane murein-binding lipoprotein Lpp
LRSLLGTFFGPTGLLAVGTLALQALPSILEFFQGMGEGAEEADKKVSEALASVFDFSEADLDQIGSDIRRVNVRLATLRDRIDELRSRQLGPGAQRARALFPSSPVEQVETGLETLESVDASSIEALPGTALRDVVRSVESVEDPSENAQEALRTVLQGLRGAQQRERQIEALEQKVQDLTAGLDKLAQKRKEVAREVRVQNALREAGVQSLQEETEAADEAADQQEEAAPAISRAPQIEPQQVPEAELIPAPEVDFEEELTLFQDLRTQLDRINRKPFLKGAEKADQRVRAVVQRIRELQRVGAALDRDVIQGIIDSLDLTEKEAKQVRDALKGAGQQAAQDFNTELQQGIRLAFQLGETLVTAFKKGEVEANKLIGQILSIVGGAVGIANPAAGAAISGLGGLISAFDEGGYTGDVGTDQVAGVVHGGEYVMSAEAVDGQVAEVHAVHELMKGGLSMDRILEVSGLPGYAGGGPVGSTVAGMTQPVTRVQVDRGGQSTDTRELRRGLERIERVIRDQTKRLENVERVVSVDRRSARKIVEEGNAYDDLKTSRPRS